MISMRNWHVREKPRERLRRLGSNALSDSEILALIIGTGSRNSNVLETARNILAEIGGLDKVDEIGMTTLAKISGVGEAKAARILAAVELGVRVLEQVTTQTERGSRIICSEDVYNAYRIRLGRLKYEIFIVLGLNSRNEILREIVVAQGSVNECYVEPREVFRPLIAEAAVRAILLHNHPSGDSSPSPEDLAVTQRLVRAGETLGIPIVDHIVISGVNHTSLRDLGLLPPH